MKKFSILSCLLLFLLAMAGFTGDEKKLVLKLPASFPKPVYDFSKNSLSPEAFLLGRKLFYDPILSRDSFTSCSSCHQQFAAFAHTDHALSHGIMGRIGKRNVPALQNLIWKDELMLDGAVNHLEVQPLAPITNKNEMDEDLKNVLMKLQRNRDYTTLFKAAFKDTIVTSERMLKALTQFVGLMISSDSRYDRYMQKKDTFSKQEFMGLKLFRSNCANCHKEPLFTDNSYRNIGLQPDSTLQDSGRAAISHRMEDYFSFKVPSLRNVELTSPYMHDGRFKNLKQVMEEYRKGNFHTTNYDKSLEKLKMLSVADYEAIIAFLKTLTDQTFLHDRRFADPNFK